MCLSVIPCPGTSALTIFLSKAGEAISHAFNAIGPIENALSIADHIAGTTSLIISATVLSQQINNWNAAAVGEQSINPDGMSEYGFADEKGEDDIINVNSKTKEVQVTKTDDNFDIVGVDGAKPVKVKKGVTEALYKSKGSYNISHLYAVGMGAVDDAIITLIGAKFTSWLFRGIAGLFARDAAKGVTAPKGWISQASKKGGGTAFKDPNNPHNIIRQMPGNPNSPNVLQQNPFKFMKEGKFYDVNGKVLPNGDVPGAHIPLNQFDMSKMPKF